MATNSGGRGPRKGVDSLVEVNEVRDVRRRLGELLNKFKTWVHSSLNGLSADDHTQYALLAGRAGGQALIGGTGSGENLILRGTSHATQGPVIVDTTGTADASTGGLAGEFIDNSDNTTAAKSGFVLRAKDDAGGMRHGAAVQFAKESAWVGGSGNYPGELSLWTRIAGGNQVKRLSISSLGVVTHRGPHADVDGGGTQDPEWRLLGASGGVTRVYAIGTDSTQQLYIYDYTAGAYRLKISSAGVVTVPNLTASQAVVTNASSQLVSVAGLTTTVGYVKSGGGNGTLTFTNGILTGSV